jgi:hypothetical protein
MIRIDLTETERQSGYMTPAHLAQAIAALADDGLVALPAVVNPTHLDILNERMADDLVYFKRRHAVDLNYQGLNPPPFRPYLFKDILLNDLVIQVTHAVLGDGVTNIGYNANTSFSGSEPQPVHADVAQLWNGLPTPSPAFALVVNVPLIDVTEENGATLYYPGTHADTRIALSDKFPTQEMLDEWAQQRPAERMCSQQGDIVIRDTRLWHGGMPNDSGQPRTMLAMGHVKRWFNGGVRFERGSEKFFAHPVLNTRATFVAAPLDYLYQGSVPPQKENAPR